MTSNRGAEQQLEYQPNSKTWRCVDCNTIWDSPSYYDDADFDRVGDGCDKCAPLFEQPEEPEIKWRKPEERMRDYGF